MEIWLSQFDHWPVVLPGRRFFAESSSPVYVKDFVPCEIEIGRPHFRIGRFLLNCGLQGFSGMGFELLIDRTGMAGEKRKEE